MYTETIMGQIMTTEGLQLIVFSTVLIISVFVLLVLYKKMKKKKADRFQNRPTLNSDDFYNAFYKDSGISKAVIIKIIKDVAAATEIPADKLRPTDRFDRELSPVKGWEFGDGLIELKWDIMKRIDKTCKTIQIPPLNTLDDLIRYMGNKNP
jgi:hypothetical protein